MVYKTNCSPKKQKRSTKQAFHQKEFSMKTVYQTNLSPKSIFHENGLQNKPVTKKRKGLHTRKTNIQENSLISKQACHQKAFSMKTFYKTSLSPKNILQENGLQNKLFTKKVSPRIRSTKQAFHKKKRSTKQTVHQKSFSKKTVYQTSLSSKKHIQKNGLQNKPSTKKNSRKRSIKKGIGHKSSPRKRSTQGPWPQKRGRSNHISDM